MTTLSHQTRRLAHNVTWLSIQEVLIRFMGLATAIYLARVLTPTAYGSLGVGLAIITILTTLVQSGTASRAIRLTALDPASIPETYSQIIGFRLFSATILITILIVSAPVISEVFSVPATLLILCSFMLVRPALTVKWAFHGLDIMHFTAIAGIAEKSMIFVGLLLLVRGGEYDLLWVPALEVVAALLMLWWLYKRLRRIHPILKIQLRIVDWPEIIREALPLGIAAMLGSVFLHSAILLLAWLDSAATAANFLVAQKIMLTMGILLFVINRAAFPSTSRLVANDRSKALNLLANLLRYYLVIIIPLVLILGLYADDVIVLLFGSAYAGSGTVLVFLLAALPFLAFSHSLQLLLRALPRPRAVLAGQGIRTMSLLVLAMILIPRFAATGAAVAVVASEAIGMTLLLWLVKRSIGAVPWSNKCFLPLMAGALAVIIFELTETWPIFSKLSMAAIVYILSIWFTKAISIAELKALPQVLSVILENRKAREPATGQD
jgi:O-antigen/teichoic acid export membrane protein